MVLGVLSRRESAFQDDDVSLDGFGLHCVFHVPFRRDRTGKDQTLVRCTTQCLGTGPRKYGFEGLSDPTTGEIRLPFGEMSGSRHSQWATNNLMSSGLECRHILVAHHDGSNADILSPDVPSDCSMTLHRYHGLAMSVIVET
jgi:hypothetical protein